MTTEPSVSFIEMIDVRIANLARDENQSPDPPQDEADLRLLPRLGEFYAEIRPADRRENTDSVLGWLARQQRHVPLAVRESLLQSEIVLKKRELFGKAGAPLDNESVRNSLRELFTVATGPFGGSTIAHQRCAELGLKAPRLFFDELDRQLRLSPVGFRALRTLDRFIKIWRGLGDGHDPEEARRDEVDRRLAQLLRQLAREAHVEPYNDFYPGGEWGVTLGRDCLKVAPDSEYARTYLADVLNDHQASDRARLYAAWVMMMHLDQEGKAAALRTLEHESSPPYLRKWAAVFKDVEHHRAKFESSGEEFTWLDRELKILEHFEDELRCVRDSIDDYLNVRESRKAAYEAIRDALESIILGVMITPDGRARRALIESVVAANLVAPVTEILVSLYTRKLRSGDLLPSGIRESLIFFLCRLRQPNSDVVDTLLVAARDESEPRLAQAGLWGLGDVWKRGCDIQGELVVERLKEAATSGHDETLQVAAAHALAIIAFNVDDGRFGKLIDKALADVRKSSLGKDGAETRTSQLAKWGTRLRSWSESKLIDPIDDAGNGPTLEAPSNNYSSRPESITTSGSSQRSYTDATASRV